MSDNTNTIQADSHDDGWINHQSAKGARRKKMAKAALKKAQRDQQSTGTRIDGRPVRKAAIQAASARQPTQTNPNWGK